MVLPLFFDKQRHSFLCKILKKKNFVKNRRSLFAKMTLINGKLQNCCLPETEIKYRNVGVWFSAEK